MVVPGHITPVPLTLPLEGTGPHLTHSSFPQVPTPNSNQPVQPFCSRGQQTDHATTIAIGHILCYAWRCRLVIEVDVWYFSRCNNIWTAGRLYGDWLFVRWCLSWRRRLWRRTMLWSTRTPASTGSCLYEHFTNAVLSSPMLHRQSFLWYVCQTWHCFYIAQIWCSCICHFSLSSWHTLLVRSRVCSRTPVLERLPSSVCRKVQCSSGLKSDVVALRHMCKGIPGAFQVRQRLAICSSNCTMMVSIIIID